MNTLKKINELDKFNVYGLYQICAFNRDHINGYSRMLRNELINLIENVITTIHGIHCVQKINTWNGNGIWILEIGSTGIGPLISNIWS